MASRNENTCICSFQGDFSVLLPLSDSQASPRSRCRPSLFLLLFSFFLSLFPFPVCVFLNKPSSALLLPVPSGRPMQLNFGVVRRIK